MRKLREKIDQIDHKGYPAYKGLQGNYQFENYQLWIDHVQGDPFATPSRIRIQIPGTKAGFPKEYYQSTYRKVALEDHLLRLFSKHLQKQQQQRGHMGSGKSGLLAVSRFGQEILQRSAVEVDEKTGEICFRLAAGFPADGRKIRGEELKRMLFEQLKNCVQRSGFYAAIDQERLRQTIELADDQQAIREALDERELVAFVANGSILPRESGISERPMKQAVVFQSPKELEITIEVPHRGKISGMGIPKGVTLIVGGGYHGKSTLLRAIEKGVYPHIAGDGREYVVTDETAFKTRAEDGRSIYGTDIRMFIQNLPNQKDTASFATLDASGSTSQAANVVEAMETKSRLLLLDEDTSATNFMIRDELMAQVIEDGKEPIIPFIRQVRNLYEKCQISTILVAGSCGAFFHVADHVIQMDAYQPYEITAHAKEKAAQFMQDRPHEAEFFLPKMAHKLERQQSNDRQRHKVKVQGRDGFMVDHTNVDLRYLEQIADAEQVMAIAKIQAYIREQDGYRELDLEESVDKILKEIKKHGFQAISGKKVLSDMALPRKQEVCACILRMQKERDKGN